jgi:hypothetical protein
MVLQQWMEYANVELLDTLWSYSFNESEDAQPVFIYQVAERILKQGKLYLMLK